MALLKVVDPATASDSTVDSPDAGKRYVAFEFKIQNSGSTTYSDSAGNDLTIYGSDGQQYQSDIVSGITAGQVLTDLALPPGQAVTGYVVAQLPTGVTAAKVQFGADSGFAQYGVWTV